MSISSREIIRQLQAHGWIEVARRGSHAQFKHPNKKGRVTVPHPKKDLPKGTIKSIERQSDINFK
ncbi:MAG: type II toxin-antitoxin system HicA family toxin [Magnetovibrio sp.]|nr:type II toxin-antitoxin system HicA family toxin [Magnetovibrio sp.]